MRILLIFFISSIQAISFETAFGECNLEATQHYSNIVKEIVISYSKEVNNKFLAVTKKPFSIYIVKDHQSLEKQAGRSIPDWVAGIAQTRYNRIIIKHPKKLGDLEETLKHELNHIYLNNISKVSYSFPTWFKEGMAINESVGGLSFPQIILFSSEKWEDQLYNINDLNQSFIQHNHNESQLAYVQSYLMFMALEDYYGPDIYRNIIQQMNTGSKFWDALVNVTQESESDIKDNIRQFLDKKYNWMFLLDRYNLIFGFLPFILIFGYWHKRYKSRKLLKKWELEELLEDLEKNDESN